MRRFVAFIGLLLCVGCVSNKPNDDAYEKQVHEADAELKEIAIVAKHFSADGFHIYNIAVDNDGQSVKIVVDKSQWQSMSHKDQALVLNVFHVAIRRSYAKHFKDDQPEHSAVVIDDQENEQLVVSL